MLKDLAQQLAKHYALPKASPKPLYLSGLAGSLLPMLLSAWSKDNALLIVAEDADEAGYIYADIEQILGEEAVMIFPSCYRRAIKYGHRDEANSLMRSMCLNALALATAEGNKPPIIVSYPEALAEAVPQEIKSTDEQLLIRKGDTIAPREIMDRLFAWDYERCDYVYEAGQYAQRGSILDIYSYSGELPYRIDFWDNEVDSIRTFEVESQLSVHSADQISLSPNLSQAGEGGVSLLSLLPHGTRLVMPDENYLLDRLGYIWEDAPVVHDEEGFEQLSDIQRLLVDQGGTRELMANFLPIYYRKPAKQSTCDTIELKATSQSIYGKDYELLCQDLERWAALGYQTYLIAGKEGQYQRVCEIVAERSGTQERPKWIGATLHEGFILEELRLVLLTEHQIFGRYHRYNLRSDKARSGKMTFSLKELSSFNLGDLVVHSEHGVGRFGGLITMDLGGRSQEVMKIEYNRGDTIYVNLHSLHKLSHYRARDAAEGVKLSTIGTGAWQRIKEKTKKQVKDIARDLIKLYAKRRDSEGFAYSADTYLQHELEASFAYIDTPDQAKATADIKADMERPYPMDRLLCGDVGFGKTEVAIRAAFKAVADGKQVAVLVPTTVLAYQHYRSFRQRLEHFPVTVEYISRAKTAKELRQTLSALKEGKVDIIIGTHRLTSKDVEFQNLGLLIIDEEQKFGVSVKERLRKLQVNVDTLTMSATPIPRTLQFSLMGARDLSNLNTPPANRVPVETILTRFSAQGIAEAVNFELSRNGQVYFVHNRIQNIEEVAAVIRREVPDARIAVGHGQMPPAALEQLLIDFGNHDYDVLVATTIIENGIDVPNANTIIINDAQRYGLSELHQLRGRVGRSNRKAFCYLLSPPLATLSDESRRRLRAIENFSDLGSGIRIALQDLDIRGAGNALGAEQSGFIADMGYETYQKIFNEAVQELKASEFSELYQDESEGRDAQHFVADTQIESDLELCLPEDYVPTDAERIILYRELDELTSDAELSAYRERLIDRFGTPPERVEALIQVPKLRRMARSRGFEKVALRSGLMSIFLPQDKASPYYQSTTFDEVLTYVARNSKQCEFRQRQDRHIIRINAVSSVAEAIRILEDMAHI